MPIYKQKGKKDGLQKYRVIVSYTEAGEHKQISRTVYGLTEAHQVESALLAQVNAPVSSRITVSDLCDRFLATKDPEVREVTLVNYSITLKTHVLPYIGSVQLDRLSVSDLEAWKAAINQKGLALSTRQHIYHALREVFLYAERVELLTKNPMSRISNFRDPAAEAPAERLRFYTAEQFQTFAAELKKAAELTGDWRYFVFFCIAFYTGMRKSEIFALRWNAIDGDVIHVRRGIVQYLNGRSVENPPKTGSSYRDLQMPDPLKKILDDQLSRHKSEAAFSYDDYVVSGKSVLPDGTLRYVKRRIARRAGLPEISLHEFRHSHASLLINEGISIQEIARRLGHTDVQTTWKVYAHLYPREEERAVRILNSVTV